MEQRIEQERRDRLQAERQQFIEEAPKTIKRKEKLLRQIQQLQVGGIVC